MKPFKNFVVVFLMAFCSIASTYCQSLNNPAPVLKTRSSVLIWPGTAPGEKGNIGEEKDNSKPTDGKVACKEVIRLGHVSKPTITIYTPKNKANGAAVIVCPGGG